MTAAGEAQAGGQGLGAHNAYRGFSVKSMEASGGAEVELVIHDGTAASGPVLDYISLSPEESAREFYPEDQEGPAGQVDGLYVEQVGVGAFELVLRFSG